MSKSRVRRSWWIGLSATVLGCIVVGAIIAPWLSPYAYDAIDLNAKRSPPSSTHLLGTDDLGRDTLSRALFAGRATLSLALIATAIAVVLGCAVGLFSGYKGGRTDMVLSGIVDIALSVPLFLLLMVLAALTHGNFATLCVVIGLSTWMPIARIVRSATLSLRERDYVNAARALGVGTPGVLARHILPNAVSPILVAAALAAVQAMLMETALGFLGFGVPAPTPTWGNMLRDAQAYLAVAPWNALVPGAFLFVTVLGLHTLADALRDDLAPDDV